MRKPLIAGNWKMNKTLGEAVSLARELKARLKDDAVETLICPPYPALALVAEALRGSKVALGAQDLHWEDSGAFTGKVSAPMLQSAGCLYVIIGHSEQRQLFGETDETVHKKLEAALRAGLKPIVCVGETLAEREAQRTWKVLETQLEALKGFAPATLATLVIAYEPVWAIGTGKVATPEQAQEAHLFIRKRLASLYDANLAGGTRILYGGSVKPDNVDAIMAQQDVDGALVGGASLKADDFTRIAGFKPGVAQSSE